MTLAVLDDALGGDGVEAIRDPAAHDRVFGDVVALYVNIGDPDATTPMYDVATSEFAYASPMDWLEAYTRRVGREIE